MYLWEANKTMKIKCIGQLAIIQQDIENLHKAVKKQQELIKKLLKELYHKAGITLNLKENNNGEV